MGIEIEFVQNKEKLDQKLMTCPLCENIFINPCMCNVCKNHFCQSCLQNALKENQKRCPVDQQAMKAEDIMKPNWDIQNQLEIVMINCQLCKNTFKLKDIETHVKEVHIRSGKNSARSRVKSPLRSPNQAQQQKLNSTTAMNQNNPGELSRNIEEAIKQTLESNSSSRLNYQNTLNSNTKRDSPVKHNNDISKTLSTKKERFFENIKPNFYADLSLTKPYHPIEPDTLRNIQIQQTMQQQNNGQLNNLPNEYRDHFNSTNQSNTRNHSQPPNVSNSLPIDYQSVISPMKYDTINDKVKFLELKSKKSLEKEKLRDTSHYVSQLSYQGVIPDDQYITLPRIMYNMPEKNPHLSNQRQEGGRVNVRTFKIQQWKNDLLKAQFFSSAERAGMTHNVRTNLSEFKEGAEEERFANLYAPPKIIVRDQFNENKSVMEENQRLKDIIGKQKLRVQGLEQTVNLQSNKIDKMEKICKELFKRYKQNEIDERPE
eukprot:403362446